MLVVTALTTAFVAGPATPHEAEAAPTITSTRFGEASVVDGHTNLTTAAIAACPTGKTRYFLEVVNVGAQAIQGPEFTAISTNGAASNTLGILLQPGGTNSISFPPTYSGAVYFRGTNSTGAAGQKIRYRERLGTPN